MTAANVFTTQPLHLSPFITQKRVTATFVDSATLVQMIKSGNEKGFHLLYDNYSGALFGILKKLVHRTDVAEDLLQDAFVKIWKNIDGFDPMRGSLFTWMLQIARNQAIDYLRSSCYRQQMSHIDNEAYAHHVDQLSNTDANICIVESKELKNKANQLDSKYAAVIDMIFIYGCTHEQTSRLLNLPLGTVKSRARKGLSLLKNIFSQ